MTTELTTRDETLAKIADAHLCIDIRDAPNSEAHEVTVWTIQSALRVAYAAGREAARKEGGE